MKIWDAVKKIHLRTAIARMLASIHRECVLSREPNGCEYDWERGVYSVEVSRDVMDRYRFRFPDRDASDVVICALQSEVRYYDHIEAVKEIASTRGHNERCMSTVLRHPSRRPLG